MRSAVGSERGAGRVLLVLLVVLLLAGGGVVGFLLGRAGEAAPRAVSSAAPFSANPSVPGGDSAGPDVLPDPDEPPLSTRLEYGEKKIGQKPFRWRYSVPAEWFGVPVAEGNVRWVLPGNPDNTYSMRIELLSDFQSPEQTSDARVVALGEDPTISHLTILRQTTDDLVFTYVKNDHLRWQRLHWLVDPDSGDAAVELSVSGRTVDEDGLQALMEHLITTTDKVG